MTVSAPSVDGLCSILDRASAHFEESEDITTAFRDASKLLRAHQDERERVLVLAQRALIENRFQDKLRKAQTGMLIRTIINILEGGSDG